MAAESTRHGLTLVHPFNDWNVIAGQGTAALELLDEAGPLDVVIAPVGGGGLLSGTALAVKGRSSGTVVIGAEPANADDARRSLETGAIQPSFDPRTIADGLRTSLGTRTFAVIRKLRGRDRHFVRGRDHRRDPLRLGAAQDRHRALECRGRGAAAGREVRGRKGGSASSSAAAMWTWKLLSTASRSNGSEQDHRCLSLNIELMQPIVPVIPPGCLANAAVSTME